MISTVAAPTSSDCAGRPTWKPLTCSTPPGLHGVAPESSHGTSERASAAGAGVRLAPIVAASIPVDASATVKLTATGLAAWPFGAGLTVPSIRKGTAGIRMSPASVSAPEAMLTDCTALWKLGVWKRPESQSVPASAGCVVHFDVMPDGAGAKSVG